MQCFLMVERLVLESLAKGGKKFSGIQGCTELESKKLERILKNLVRREYIVKEDERYRLNHFSHKSDIRTELKELMSSFVNSYFLNQGSDRPLLKVQKFWVSEEEEVVFNSIMGNLQEFVEKVSLQSRDRKMSEKKVMVWGVSNYSGLVEQSLAAV